jgi:hypothetical protein
MQYLAVPRIVAWLSLVTVCAKIRMGDVKYPATPVAAILKKIRLSMMESIASIVK